MNQAIGEVAMMRPQRHSDFENNELSNIRSVILKSDLSKYNHAARKHYVDNTIDESSFIGKDPDEKWKLDEKDSIFLNSKLTSPKSILEIPTKSYVDSLHENSWKRRELSLVFDDQDNELHNNKLTILDSITINRNSKLDSELSNKKYVVDSTGEGTIVRFNQTLENYLKVSVRNDAYNRTKYDKTQITETTTIEYPNSGGYLPQQWNIKCFDKNNNGKKNTSEKK